MTLTQDEVRSAVLSRAQTDSAFKHAAQRWSAHQDAVSKSQDSRQQRRARERAAK